MRSIVGEIEKERLVRRILKMLVNKLIGVFCDALGQVIILTRLNRIVIKN